MSNFLDWILSKTKIVEVEDELEESEIDEEFFGILWPIYDDCNSVIDNYKAGVLCIYRIEEPINVNALALTNYISGGIYALDGTVSVVSENVFVVIARKRRQQLPRTLYVKVILLQDGTSRLTMLHPTWLLWLRIARLHPVNVFTRTKRL